MPENVHPGLYMDGAYHAFFADVCGLDFPPENPSNPLNFISHRPVSRESSDWRKTIQKLVATTNWKSLFGLNYEETINLPYAEFLSMRELQSVLAEEAMRRKEEERRIQKENEANEKRHDAGHALQNKKKT